MFTDNLKEAWSADADGDTGSLVETVLLIAGFAIVAILVVTWIGGAIAGQAADVSECIANSNSYAAAGAADVCADSDKADAAQAANENTDGWKQRF